MNKKHIEKSFARQHDSSDCGVACLLSLIRLNGGENTLEKLREMSGTNKQGTTLLGLQQSAQTVGFVAEGCEAESVQSLLDHGSPVILHVLIENQLQHYIVWYGYTGKAEDDNRITDINIPGKHLIGDPARGVLEISTTELEKIWVSKKCLTLEPDVTFQKSENNKSKRLHWFLDLLREDTPLLISAAILGLAMAALGMVMAIFSQKLIDEILPEKDYLRLIGGVSMVAVLLIFRSGLDAIRTYLILRQSKDFNNRIIRKFYTGLLNLPKAFFDVRKTGDLVARMNDTTRIQRVISQLAGQVLIDTLMVIVTSSFLFYYSWQIGLALILCIPVYLLIIYRFHTPIKTGQKSVMMNYALNESNYISSLQGIRPIKPFNRKELFSEMNRKVYGEYQESIFKLGGIQLKLNIFASIASVVILIGTLTFSSFSVLKGSLKAGELMAILSMASSLLPSVANLALLAIPIGEARVAFDRMFEFLELPGESERLKDEEEKIDFQALHVNEVTFRFSGRPALLKNVSLHLNKGEIIGIVGESGCGKSTLIQLIEGFYRPESGVISLNKTYSPDSVSIQTWRKNVASVPQDVHIFNGTVLDNIILHTEITAGQIQDFFGKEPFLSFIMSLPQGLATLVGEEGLNLSGGQKQWIGLMRALFFKPKLLLLDEATSAMDMVSENKVLDLLLSLDQEMGIIYVSHRLHTIPKICNRIYVLDKGELIASGSHEEVLESENLYSSFWNQLIMK